MKKNIFGIIGVLLSVISFCIYYIFAAKPLYVIVPQYIINLAYYSLFIGLALSFFQLRFNAETNIKHLLYDSGSGFWTTVFLCYLLRDLLIITSKDMLMYFIIGTVIFTILFFYIKRIWFIFFRKH